MHLWPSVTVRNSFKRDYLHNIERVNTLNSLKKPSSKSTSTNNTKLLHPILQPFSFCNELLMIFTCCFCFGGGESSHYIEFSGFKLDQLPFKYLGMTVSAKKLSISDCQYLIGNVVNRIRWGSRSMSYTGRAQVVNSVLMSLHVY